MKQLLKALLASLVFAAPIACGGDSSGVDGSKSLSELTPAERRTLCEFTVGESGGDGSVMCSDFEVSSSVNDCANDDTSMIPAACTVKMAEDCASSTGGDKCKTLSTSECQMFIACQLGG